MRVQHLLRAARLLLAADTAATFAAGFFQRHPQVQSFAPTKVVDKAAGTGSHPEARQSGNEIGIYPKFWHLDAQQRDFVFAHEIGHYVLSQHSPMQLIADLDDLGVDAWDVSQLPYGQHNMDEAFADCFASYYFGHAELKQRYPEWASVIQRIVGTKTATGRPSSYRVDARKADQMVARANDPESQAESDATLGGHDVAEFRLVPIQDINVPPVWHPGRLKSIEAALDVGTPLPPVTLVQTPQGLEISDGIHRTNASKLRGFTSVPAVVYTWVETPRMAGPRPMKEEKLKALLLKLRKGSGWGTIKGLELEQVFKYLGGWKLDEVPTLDGGIDDDPHYYRARDAQDAKHTHDAYKAQEVNELPGPEEIARLPRHTQMYTDVQDVVQNPEYPEEIGFYYRSWQISTGTIITSPDQQVFTSKEGAQSFLNAYPENFYGITQDGTRRNLMGWLTLDTGFLAQVSDRLGLETYEVERRKEKALRTRENTGTCPACFTNFKLTPKARKGGANDLPGMVLHGYQRPGIGYIFGNCFGQDYPPFELSVVGTVAWRAAQQAYLESQEDRLGKFNRNEIDVLHKGEKTYKRSETPEAEWSRLYLKEINDLKRFLTDNKKYIASLDKEIKDWKLRPLPKA